MPKLSIAHPTGGNLPITITPDKGTAVAINIPLNSAAGRLLGRAVAHLCNKHLAHLEIDAAGAITETKASVEACLQQMADDLKSQLADTLPQGAKVLFVSPDEQTVAKIEPAKG